MAGFPRPKDALSLKVNELLARWPAAARGFLDHRMACIGCQFSGFDSLQEALDVHHVPVAAFFESFETASASESPTSAGPSHAQGEDE